MKISRANSVGGTIILPGDKSISHRAAMIASLADGRTRIENFAASADCASTLECIRALGVDIQKEGSTVFVRGVGKNGFSQPASPLDCGNSGTTMRLLSGILAGQAFESTLTGDDSLQKRPMGRVASPLEKMGASVSTTNGKAPLIIAGNNPLQAIEYQPESASAQIKSCVLLAGLNADGKTTVIEPAATRDHTERMLSWFDVTVETETIDDATHISVSGDAKLTARDLSVPSDISSAAFFMIAAACLPGSDISMPNVGMNPSRRGAYDVLLDLGIDMRLIDVREECNEPVATINVIGGLPNIRGETPVIRGRIIANLIDEIPILAILGTQLKTGIEIRDAGELRVKESDRISAVVENLQRMGGNIVEFPDGFRIGHSQLKGAALDSFGDHRIAMAFAVAGLFADGETEIDGADCADISFPGFFETLDSVVR